MSVLRYALCPLPSAFSPLCPLPSPPSAHCLLPPLPSALCLLPPLPSTLYLLPMTKTQKLPWISATLFALLFLVTLVLAYKGLLPSTLQAIPHYDKPGHVILYGVAAYLGHRLLQQRYLCLLGLRVPLWIFLFSTFTVVEELVQGFSPNRSLDMLDLICSGVGIALGYWLAEREAS